jgi:glyoxylase-like metal-dependent hydrolase (beta-lactamase superfamily II)
VVKHNSIYLGEWRGGGMVQLTDSIYLVAGGDYCVNSLMDCNTYLIRSKGELALIDAGCGTETEHLLTTIKQHGLNPTDIAMVILTHSHFDHSGGASYIREVSGAKVCIHKKEADTIRTFDSKVTGLAIAQKIGVPYQDTLEPRPCPVDRELENDDKLRLGSLTLQITHTPGHTAGSICISTEINSKVSLFTGDSVFADLNLPYMNIPTSNLATYLNSMKKLFRLLKRRRVNALFPGHRCFMLEYAQQRLDAYEQKLQLPFTSIQTPK